MASITDGVSFPGGGAWERYTCPHCSLNVSGGILAKTGDDLNRWLRCPACLKGAVVVEDLLSPAAPFGPPIVGLPGDVDEAYQEARRCMGVNAYTAAELVCRKILMHVAVDKGAKPGKAFADYVTHLADAGYVTPPMQPWVDLIRQHGNLATHELPPPDQQRAESTVMFTAELLRLVYEMDHMAQQYAPTQQAGT
jgi:hypothetical protein